uniref:SCP domain-containing protein n=1 Tax=Parastrongyloides trichosuri TaxID=131310 RepID=A0A0N4Z6B9_PARTI
MSFLQLIQDIYSITNAFRRCHGANPLQVSQNLVNSAQRYANILAQSPTGQLIHDPNNYDQGENLASSSPNIAYVGVRMWYDEYKLYNYNAGVFTKGTGHFTQLVWKNTQYMGCAAATSTRWNLVFIVCRYSPPGNYQGQFFENVGRQVCLVDY